MRREEDAQHVVEDIPVRQAPSRLVGLHGQVGEEILARAVSTVREFHAERAAQAVPRAQPTPTPHAGTRQHVVEYGSQVPVHSLVGRTRFEARDHAQRDV